MCFLPTMDFPDFSHLPSFNEQFSCIDYTESADNPKQDERGSCPVPGGVDRSTGHSAGGFGHRSSDNPSHIRSPWG